MNSESHRRDPPAARHAHPATWLVSGIIFVSYLGLNFWSPGGNHGFPFVWMTRSIPFALRDDPFSGNSSGSFSVGPNWNNAQSYDAGGSGVTREVPDRRVNWNRVRAALPLEWFIGDFSRVTSFSIPKFLVAVALGAWLSYFPFSWFDWFFGRRPQPFYRFGLLRLMIGVSAFAVFFALTNEYRTLFIAKVIVVLAVPASWLGISAWVVRRERAMARGLVRQRRERREREDAGALVEQTLKEIELTDAGA
jgi:hypothetical protein